jgi:hypothetical protein
MDEARASAGRAAAAAQRLRQQLAANSATAAASAAAPSPNCAPALAAASVHAELLDRAVQRSLILADFADRSQAAGQACERAYDALRMDPAPAK